MVEGTAEESVEVKLAGVPIKIRGREVILILIILILLASIAWLVNNGLKSWGEPFNVKDHFEQHQTEMNTQHTNYVNGVNELTYVMSVCLNKARAMECERLRFAMPDSLYRKLKD